MVNLWIVHPGPHSYPVSEKTSALALRDIASLPGQARQSPRVERTAGSAGDADQTLRSALPADPRFSPFRYTQDRRANRQRHPLDQPCLDFAHAGQHAAQAGRRRLHLHLVFFLTQMGRGQLRFAWPLRSRIRPAAMGKTRKLL